MFGRRCCVLLLLLAAAAPPAGADELRGRAASESEPALVEQEPAPTEEKTEPAPTEEAALFEEPAPTEAAPEEPAPSEAPASAVAAAMHEMWIRLETTKYQWANALLALVYGLVMVFDGEEAFKYLVLGVLFWLASVLAISEIASTGVLGEPAHEGWAKIVLGWEIGLLAVFASTERGDKASGERFFVLSRGLLVVIASVLGFATSHYIQGLLEHFGPLNKWVTLTIYTIVVLGFVVLAVKEIYKKVLVVVCPFFGGSLVVSSCSYLLTYLVVHHKLDWTGRLVEHVDPSSTNSWIQFLAMLWSRDAGDHGLFTNVHFQVLGRTWELDRVLGYLWWTAFFIAGTIVQYKRHKKLAAARQLKDDKAEPLLAA